MAGVDCHLVSVYGTCQPVDTSVVSVFGEYSERVCDRMLTQQTCVIRIERIIIQSFLFQRSHNTLVKTSVMIITHFAECHKVGLQAHYLINDCIISSRNHCTFLPYIPLQNRKLTLSFTLSRHGDKQEKRHKNNLFHFIKFILCALFFFRL